MNSSPEPALQVNHLRVSFVEQDGSLEVLDDVTFSLQSSYFASLIGPSGGGKSTLLRALAGLVEPNAGEILYAGKSLKNAHPKIGMVFQNANLMPWRTVIENILLPLQLVGETNKEAHEKAQEMVMLVGLSGFEKKFPDELSGGMAQRVALARALIHDPDILLLDEPFASLDALTRERMGAELLRIWQNTRKTVLLVTHSISEAVFLSDRVLVLTGRPAKLCLDLQVTLPRPRSEHIRYTPEFNEITQKLRQQLDLVTML